MHKKIVPVVLLLFPLLAIAAPEQNASTNGVVIPADVRAGLGDTSKTAKVLPPDSGFLGVVISHMPANYGVITQIVPNGPADKAKLRVGDKITIIDGKPIPYMNGMEDTISPVLAGNVGAITQLTVSRDGKLVTVKLVHKKLSFKTVKTPDGQEKHVPVFE